MMQSRALVAYAPQSTSTEDFPALPVATVPFLSDGSAFRPALPRSPRSRVNEQLTALATPGGAVSNGVPWNSSQSLARASYSPANQCDDVLLPLVAPFGPWLDTPPAISRYTIITLAQEDAAELPRIPPPGTYFDMSEPWAVGKVVRSELLRIVRVHDDALPGIFFTPFFVQAGAGRTEYGTYRHRTAYGVTDAMLSPKDPDAIEWMTRDCTRLLAANGGGAIVSIISEAFEEGDGACSIVVAAALSSDGLKWSIKVAGGTPDVTYRYRARVFTSNDETIDTSLSWYVTDPVH